MDDIDVDEKLVQRQLDFMAGSAQEFDDRAIEDVDVLYHYTDVTGLMSIMRTHELWASNVFFMNDESEIRHSLTKIHEIVSNQDYPEEKVGIPHRIADRVIEKIVNDFAQYVNVYAVCFCRSDDLLSQWRAYGANGGYAIGFDAAQLRKLTSRRVALMKVSYDDDEQERALSELVRKWRQSFVGLSEGDEYFGPTMRIMELTFAEAFSMVGLAFKDKGFREEEEWRLVYRKSEVVPDDGVNFPIDFRARNGSPMPFARVGFGSDEGAAEFVRPIRDVVMGRRNYSNVAGFALVKFFLSLGGWHEDIGIRLSSIPLRAWST